MLIACSNVAARYVCSVDCQVVAEAACQALSGAGSGTLETSRREMLGRALVLRQDTVSKRYMVQIIRRIVSDSIQVRHWWANSSSDGTAVTSIKRKCGWSASNNRSCFANWRRLCSKLLRSRRGSSGAASLTEPMWIGMTAGADSPKKSVLAYSTRAS
jgi:hypothetical protein